MREPDPMPPRLRERLQLRGGLLGLLLYLSLLAVALGSGIWRSWEEAQILYYVLCAAAFGGVLFLMGGLRLGEAFYRRLVRRGLAELREDPFTALLNLSSSAVLIVQDARIRLANPEAGRLTGCAPGDLADQLFLDFIGPDERDKVWRLYEEGLRSGEASARHEAAVLHRKGHALPVEMVVTRVQYEGRSALEVLLQDLTPRRMAERTFREREQILTSFMDNSQDLFFRTDADGCLIFVSPAWGRITGYDAPGELLGARLAAQVSLDAEAGRALIEDVRAQGAVTNRRLSLRRKDGTALPALASAHRHYDSFGAFRGIEGVFHDISAFDAYEHEMEQKNLELQARAAELERSQDAILSVMEDMEESRRRLMDSEARLRNLGDNIPNGAVFQMLSDSGGPTRFTYVSGGVQKLFGLTAEELTGDATAFESQLVNESPDLRRNLLRDSAERLTLFDRENRVRRADGRIKWIWTCAHPRRESPERVVWDGLMLDITDRKQAEEDLSAMYIKLSKALEEIRGKEKLLVQQERLRALGQMASGVAHDFNNNLQPILLAAGMLDQPELAGNPETVKEFARDILKSARQAAQTVRRLMRFYRPVDQDRRTMADFGALAREAVALTEIWWQDEARARNRMIHMQLELEENCRAPLMQEDIKEVLINLIFNAVEAIRTEGNITIRVRRAEPWAVLEVQDTGAGMTEEVRAHCLEPFYTTKTETGAGLGLSIVYGIVRQHGGELEIESSVGLGSTIRVKVPLDAPDLLTEPSGGLESERAITQKMHPARVLLADDEEAILQMLGQTMKLWGHQVTMVSNGTEALEIFRRQDFDLVITDQAMPGLIGEALARRIKELRPKVPVIMLSGFGSLLRSEKKIPAGVDILLSKPVTLSELRLALLRLLPPPGPAAG